MNRIELKWQLKDHVFFAEYQDYEITTWKAGRNWIWDIRLNKEEISHAYYYRPSTGGEAGARVQAEKVLYNIINNISDR